MEREQEMSITKLSFKTKLVVMLLPALIGLLFYSVSTLLERYGTMNNMAELKTLVELTNKTSAVIHEYQTERGLSAGFLSSRGEKFAAELKSQREVTDKKLAEFKAFLEQASAALSAAGVSSSIKAANNDLSRLANSRDAISALGFTPKDSYAYYTGSIASLMNIIQHTVFASNNPELLMQAT